MIRATVARLTLAALVAGIAAAALPASAPAFQWGNRCYEQVHNNTNVTFRQDFFLAGGWPLQFSVPIDWQYRQMVRDNPRFGEVEPGADGVLLSSVGVPITLGCHFMVMIDYEHKGSLGFFTSRVTCFVDSSTWDKNSIRCNVEDTLDGRPYGTGWFPNFEFQKRVDKPGLMGATIVLSGIYGDTGAPVGVSPAPPPTPKTEPPLLRRGDLPGRGWRAPTAREGRELGDWIARSKPRGGCAGARTSSGTGSSTAGWVWVRDHSGEELVTGTELRFGSAAEARGAQTTSLSAVVARCLASAISARKGLSASARPLKFGKVGDSSSAYRIVIHSSAPRGGAYLDLVSLRKGRGTAVIGFYAEDHQMAAGVERAAAHAVARRIER